MDKHIALLSATTVLLTIAPASSWAQVTFREFAQDYTIITDASADASVVVGLYDSPAKTTVFRWTASEGVQLIGAPGMSSNPRISRDGRTIVGTLPDSRGCATAAIWQGGTTWKLLDSFPGVVPSEQNTCTDAVAVSADGSVVVGGAYLSLTKVVTFRWDVAERYGEPRDIRRRVKFRQPAVFRFGERQGRDRLGL